jgi:hypothetical protein
MVLTYLSFLWSRKNVKILLISGLTGRILPLLARQYLNNHLEWFEDASVTQTKKRQPKFRFLNPRGGGWIEILGMSIRIVE